MRTVHLHIAVGADHEQVGRGEVPAEVREQVERALVGVVEVLEHQAEGNLGGSAAEKRHDGLEEAEAILLGCGGRRRLHLEAVAQFRDDARHVRGARAQLLPERRGVPVEDVGAQRLDEGEVGQGQRAFLVTVSREGAATGRGDVGAELLADGGLADARLPHHHHQPALAGAGGVEGALERGELPFPPHERAAVGGDRRLAALRRHVPRMIASRAGADRQSGAGRSPRGPVVPPHDGFIVSVTSPRAILSGTAAGPSAGEKRSPRVRTGERPGEEG